MSRKRSTAAAWAVDPGYTDEESEFIAAMERYRREKRRPFPTLCETLAVLKALGYRKVEPESDTKEG